MLLLSRQRPVAMLTAHKERLLEPTVLEFLHHRPLGTEHLFNPVSADTGGLLNLRRHSGIRKVRGR